MIIKRFLCWLIGHDRMYMRVGIEQTDFDVYCRRCDKFV